MTWHTKEGIKYRIVKKENSRFMKFLNFFVKRFNPIFMDRYVTVLGKTIYAPGGCISETTLLHELQHIKDRKKWWILFDLSYLLFLPLGFTMRAHWEKKGYSITIKDTYKKNPRYAETNDFKERIVSNFVSSKYLWMCPFRKHMEKWFDTELDKTRNEYATERIKRFA